MRRAKQVQFSHKNICLAKLNTCFLWKKYDKVYQDDVEMC